jgi:hypothetical protein
MLKSVEGVYRDGKIELTEFPGDVRDETRVIVTFLEMSQIDLQTRGIDEAQAAELRAQTVLTACSIASKCSVSVLISATTSGSVVTSPSYT